MNTTVSPLTIALPKGRLMKPIRECFARCNIDVGFGDRGLISEDREHTLRFILVKNSDLPIYVYHGIAGLGICGYDVLLESGYDLFRLLEFDFGQVQMCLAAHADTPDEPLGRYISVATKFPHFTRRHFQRRGIHSEIIHLNGSVELAPLLGLAPYIVDIVETGATLRDNNLRIVEALQHMSAHLIANPAYYKFHHRRVDTLREMLQGGLGGKND